MDFNLFFDIAAIVILVFLIFSIILKKQFILLSNKFYLAVIAVTLIGSILDILASLEFFSIPTLFALNTFFVLFRSLTALTLFLYTLNLAKIYHLLKKNKWIYSLLFLPLLVLIVFLIINIFNKSMFDYLEGPVYKRGEMMLVAYIVGYIYVFSSLIIVIYSHKYYLKTQITAMVVALLAQAGAQVFQFFVGNVLIEMFVTAITLLTLSLFIENPEYFIDYKTNALNYRSFTTDIRQEFDMKTSFNVLFIKVTNTSTLYNLYPQKKAVVFNRSCTAAVAAKAKKLDKNILAYFLGNATFAYYFTNRDIADDLLKLVHQEFAIPMSNNEITFQFSAKTCLVSCPEDCRTVADLVAFSTTFFDLTEEKHLDIKPFRQEHGNLLFELDHILERAINEKSFSVYYQGIYSLKEKRFTSAEALLRLKDPQFGMIMPSLMIPYAEARNKNIGIGLVVIEKAFAFFVSHLRGKLDYIEINLAPSQLSSSSLAKDIDRLAKQYGIEPHEVIFEILETTMCTDDPNTENNMKELSELGYRLAVDDFGTGYSNLSRIMNIDTSIIKFDKSMTDILNDMDKVDFLTNLLPIFRKRKIKILFEGVENKETSDLLEKLKVDYIQGYYYCGVLPEDEFLKKIN